MSSTGSGFGCLFFNFCYYFGKLRNFHEMELTDGSGWWRIGLWRLYLALGSCYILFRSTVTGTAYINDDACWCRSHFVMSSFTIMNGNPLKKWAKMNNKKSFLPCFRSSGHNDAKATVIISSTARQQSCSLAQPTALKPTCRLLKFHLSYEKILTAFLGFLYPFLLSIGHTFDKESYYSSVLNVVLRSVYNHFNIIMLRLYSPTDYWKYKSDPQQD